MNNHIEILIDFTEWFVNLWLTETSFEWCLWGEVSKYSERWSQQLKELTGWSSMFIVAPNWRFCQHSEITLTPILQTLRDHTNSLGILS
jgi:hypothetical protein